MCLENQETLLCSYQKLFVLPQSWNSFLIYYTIFFIMQMDIKLILLHLTMSISYTLSSVLHPEISQFQSSVHLKNMSLCVYRGIVWVCSTFIVKSSIFCVFFFSSLQFHTHYLKDSLVNNLFPLYHQTTQKALVIHQ